MFVPLPVVVAAVALILLLAMLLIRAGREGRDLIGPPKSLVLPASLETQVAGLLAQGIRIAAITLAGTSTRAGLGELRKLVEKLVPEW